MSRTEILNAMWSVMAELRVARALISDQVRGTNDVKYDLVKSIDCTLKNGEKAYKEMQNKLPL